LTKKGEIVLAGAREEKGGDFVEKDGRGKSSFRKGKEGRKGIN